MSKLVDAKRVIDRGGTVDSSQIPSDQEVGRQAGNMIQGLVYPENDPDGMYKRIQRVLGVVKPESQVAKNKVEPRVTVPLIVTLQRSEVMPTALKTFLAWNLFQSTDWGRQRPQEAYHYGFRRRPDGNVEIVILDKVELELVRADETVAAAPRASGLWARVRQSPRFRTWFPIYRTLCLLYALWITAQLLPKPLPRGEGAAVVAMELAKRVLLVVLAWVFAPAVMLIRFFSHYRIVLRSTLARDPLLRGRRA
jgi:hypothetical protein